MPTRIEEYKVPRKHHPTPIFSRSIEDPELYKQSKGKLFDVTVTVGHSLKGVDVHAVQNGTGRIEKIEAGTEGTIVFFGRLTDVYIRHEK